eukprot:CAMPEP_0179359336 /NCGR_PEP_ID=MMETSP0797-20121207/79390_1 /TAXON_ID=47934 /ORGANISM="Dinophysis acuminata, Strain DAEP01" /LENGTH=138 /DNA_ID=CAMNT_0021074619 /DNA_START=852 /DNA_END=1267 /DNA_ORIENTATION=+
MPTSYEKPHTKEPSSPNNVSVLLPRTFVLAVQMHAMREIRTTESGKRIDSGELEDRGDLHVAGVHGKFDCLKFAPFCIQTSLGSTKHQSPEAACGPHCHDAEHNGHRHYEEHPIDPPRDLPGKHRRLLAVADVIDTDH